MTDLGGSNPAENVAIELTRLRGDMNTGFARIGGQLDVLVQSQTQIKDDLTSLEDRVTALEERRIPLGPLAALSGAISAIIAAVALIVGQ